MSRGNHDIFKKRVLLLGSRLTLPLNSCVTFENGGLSFFFLFCFVTMRCLFIYVFCKIRYLRYFLVLKFKNFKHKHVKTKLNLDFILFQ